MKSKGFTLAEILVVIVILGILITIATPVYFRISQTTKNNALKTKIDYLKSRAVTYAEENEIDSATTINVLALIYSGYVVPDEYLQEDGYEMPYINNPVDEEDNLACRTVYLTFEDNEISANVSDESNCDLENVDVEEESLGITLYPFKDNKIIGSALNIEHNVAEWSSNDILMVVNPTESNVKKIMITYGGKTKVVNEDKLTSVTSSTVISGENSNTLIITSQNTLTTEATISIQYENTVKSKKITLRIDKEAPVATIESYGGWVNQNDLKGATVYLSDGDGSGPAGIYVTANNYLDKSTAEYIPVGEENKNIATINPRNNGSYYVWAVDNVGNVSKNSTALDITTVDKDIPECMIPSYPNHWVNYDVELTWGCRNDTEAGCRTLPKTRVWNRDGVYKEIINFDIQDNVLNNRGCVLNIDSIKIDKVPPICTGIYTSPSSPNPNGWFNRPVTLIYGCAKDDKARSSKVSGCATPNETRTYYDDNIYKNIVVDWDIMDVATNHRHCNDVYKELKIDKTPPELYGASLSSRKSEYKSKDVRLKFNASDNLSGISEVCLTEGLSNNCSWIPVNGQKYVDLTLPYPDGSGQTCDMNVYVRDFAYNVSNGSSVSYTMYGFCQETKWIDDTDCSATCGDGTKMHHQIDKYFEKHSCSEKKSTSCNVQECPPENDDDDGGGGGGGGDDSPSSCCCAGYYVLTGDCASCQACPPPGTCYGSQCG